MSKYLLLFIVIGNVILFSIGMILNVNMSLLGFIALAYIAPVLYNNIINLIFKSNKKFKNSVVISAITTVCYFIFSIYFISRPDFSTFVENNSRKTGDVSIEINTQLANVDQLIFIFLLNFIFLFLISLFKRKEDNNVTNSKLK